MENPFCGQRVIRLILGKRNRVFMANHSTRLKTGAKAPDFRVKDQNGKWRTLADFKGKKLVLYFYPKDDTPTCTNEACNLRDNYKELKRKGYEVLGVSADTEKKHTKFIQKYALPFSLLADEQMDLIRAYDVWGEKLFMGRIFDGIVRTTFIIDGKGIIEKVITNVRSKEHAAQITGSGDC